MSDSTKTINVSGKTRTFQDNTEKTINYKPTFYSINDIYAHTNVNKTLWEEIPDYINFNTYKNETKDIKSNINQIVHAAVIDWDSPENVESLKIYNDNNDIKTTADIFYVLEKLADYFINYKEKKLTIEYRSKEGSANEFYVYGYIDGQLNNNIVWSCNNKYAKLSTNIGSTTILTIDLDNLIKDNIDINLGDWRESNQNNGVFFKEYECVINNIVQNDSINGLTFNINATYNDSISSEKTIEYPKNNINISEYSLSIKKIDSSSTYPILSIQTGDRTRTVGEIKQQESSTSNNQFGIIQIDSIKLYNGYTCQYTDDKVSKEFKLYFVNTNDIYVAKINNSEYENWYNTEYTKLKTNILSELNIKMSDIYNVDKDTYVYNANLANNEKLIIIYPDLPYNFIENNLYNVIKTDEITTTTTALYFKHFNVKILENNQSQIKTIEFNDNYQYQYLTFRALSNNFQCTLNILSDYYKNSNYVSKLEYSIDNGRSWSESSSSFIYNSDSYLTIYSDSVKKFETILLRGDAVRYAKTKTVNGETVITDSTYLSSNDTQFMVFGNILSLLYLNEYVVKNNQNNTYNIKNTFKKDKNQNLPTHVFANLFYESYVYDAKKLYLPVASLTTGCYALMFNNCARLKYIPTLGYVSLAESCYENMFKGCIAINGKNQNISNLLPVTTLTRRCYYGMFEGCINLQTTPNLPATNLADRCYEKMFKGYGDDKGATAMHKLTTVAKLPATELAARCYYEMFRYCNQLTTTPEFGNITNLALGACEGMFNNCTSLTTIHQSLINIFNKTTLNISPRSFCHMFANCGLTTAPNLNSTKLNDSCYYGMFRGCINMTETMNTLPAINLAKSCYQLMFNYCPKITKSPIIPKVNLAEKCCNEMFRSSQNLSEITLLLEECDDMKTYFENWVMGVNTVGTFNKSYTATWKEIDGDNAIPKNWIITNTTGKYGINFIYNDTNNLLNTPFTIKNESTKSINIIFNVGVKSNLYNNRDKIKLTYKKNNSNTWGDCSYGGTDAKAKQMKIELASNQYVQFRIDENAPGDLESLAYDFKDVVTKNFDQTHWCTIWSQFKDGTDSSAETPAKYSVSGNIMSLLYKNYNDIENNNTVKRYALMRLFSYSTRNNTEQATKTNAFNLISAKNLILPARIVEPYGYEYMFEGCKALSGNAPIILAYEIGARSMQKMFYDCKNLTSAKLLINKINTASIKYTGNNFTEWEESNSSLSRAFYGCTNLTGNINLYTNEPLSKSYFGMFYNCKNLQSVYLYCNDSIFNTTNNANIKTTNIGIEYYTTEDEDDQLNWLPKTTDLSEKSYVYITNKDVYENNNIFPQNNNESYINRGWVKAKV